MPIGTVIGTLGGRDNDSTTFTYEIFDQFARSEGQIFPDDVNSFEIVGGQLVTTAPINFEQYSEYFVRIDFTDKSGHAGFDTIKITVDNANDPLEFGNLGGLDQISGRPTLPPASRSATSSCSTTASVPTPCS